MAEENKYISVRIDDKEDDNTLLKNNFDISAQLREENNRKNRKDRVTHFLASVIIGIFLICVLFEVFLEKKVPSYFISIASMVVTFYFAKELNKK